MFRGEKLQEDSDEIERMPRNTIDTETDELYMPQLYGSHRTGEDHGLRTMAVPQDEKRRKKRTKSQLQHCPSCHCTPDTMNHFPTRIMHSDNVEAVLDRYEHLFIDPDNPTIKKSQSSPLSPCRHSRSKRKQSVSRRQRKNEQNEIFSMLKKYANSGITNEGVEACRAHGQHAKSNCKANGRWRDRQTAPRPQENSDGDSGSPENVRDYQAHRRSHVSRKESRGGRQCVGKTTESRMMEKIEKREDKEMDDWLIGQRLAHDAPDWSRLRFQEPDYEKIKNVDLRENVVDEREERIRRKTSNLYPKLLQARSAATKTSGSQNPMGKNKPASTLEASDCSKDEDVRKDVESLPYFAGHGRPVLRRDSRPEEDSTTNAEDIREDTRCEITVKDKNQETTTIRKNVYAGGDIDLHATKGHILGLIDRALSNEFGTVLDQQKIIESKQGSTQQEICIEITRALQGDCCQSLAQNLLEHRGTSADYVKQLKILRWEYLNHIQDEVRKLCSLEKFLDTCSPRQSLPTLQTHPNAVEQRVEERQQVQEDKPELEPVS